MRGAPDKRRAVRELEAAGVSKRRACSFLVTSRSSLAYEPKPKDDEQELIVRIGIIRAAKPRWGYKRVAAKLRREGFEINRKRVHRLWKQLGYQLPRRRPRPRRRTGASVPMRAEYADHVWTYDFIHDATAPSRSFKVLTVIDEYTRRALALVPGRSVTAAVVKTTLGRLFTGHGIPAHIRSDNGPEFIAFELTEWLAELGAGCVYIQPGKPWQNAYGESFNSRFRDECLNMHEFYSMRYVEEVLAAWLIEYNSGHLHSSLDYRTPDEFAAACRVDNRKPRAALRAALL